MSEQSSQEPTMEEILASIRRIISEDDTPAAETPAAPAAEAAPEPEPEPVAAAPQPEPEPEPAAAAPAPVVEPTIVEPTIVDPPDDDDDDLELTQKVETHGDLDVLAPREPEPARAARAFGVFSYWVAAAPAASFEKLSATIAMPAAGRTLEDVVRELLRPLLQQWLDDNLPGIVQEAVQAEVERIARGRVR